MNFDYTYITVFGFMVYEPMVLFTNLIFFLISWYGFSQLKRFDNDYAKYMRLFIFLLGLSSIFGAIGHAVHYQLGNLFFETVLFLMHALSLFAIYYCFLAPFIYVTGINQRTKNYLLVVRIWVLVLLILSLISHNFVLIKVNAGLVLTYSLITHIRAQRTRSEGGNRLVVFGILASFLPIIIHSFKLSISTWFNYKDLAHVFMIISLIVIFIGAYRNSKDLETALE